MLMELRCIDTLSHMLWNGFFFKNSKEKWNIIIGGLLPDIALIVITIILTPTKLFSPFKPWADQLMQIPWVFFIDTIFHSLPFWGIGFILFKTFGIRGYGIWIGAIIHVFIDVLTHHFYIIPYMWPISGVKPLGIVDYRDKYFTLINWTLIIVILAYFAFKKKKTRKKH